MLHGFVGRHARWGKARHVLTGVAMHDLLGEQGAHAAARQNPQRVETGPEVEPRHLGALAHQETAVGGKTFGAAEKGFQARCLHGGKAAKGMFQMRGHPVPIGGQGAETGIRRH